MEPCVSCIYLTYCMEYVWKSSLWIGIFQRATQFNNEQEYYWPTIYRAGAAVVSTVITSCYSFLLLRWNAGLFFVCFQIRVRKNWTEVFFHFLCPSLLFFSPQFSFCEAVPIHSTKHKRFKSPRKREVTDFCASRKQLMIKKYSSEIGLISTPW